MPGYVEVFKNTLYDIFEVCRVCESCSSTCIYNSNHIWTMIIYIKFNIKTDTTLRFAKVKGCSFRVSTFHWDDALSH